MPPQCGGTVEGASKWQGTPKGAQARSPMFVYSARLTIAIFSKKLPPLQLSEKKRKKQIKAEVRESHVGECKSLAPFDFLIYTNNRDSAFNEAFNCPKYPVDLIMQQSCSFFKNVCCFFNTKVELG